jgi:hypothetical protein
MLIILNVAAYTLKKDDFGDEGKLWELLKVHEKNRFSRLTRENIDKLGCVFNKNSVVRT